jgi:hypothetical protein
LPITKDHQDLILLHHSFMHHDGGLAAAGVVSSMCAYCIAA